MNEMADPKPPKEQEVVNDGTNRTVLPSDIDGVSYRYGVTPVEAERIIRETGTTTDDNKLRKAADEVRGSRTVFKQGYVVDDAGTSVPQGFADAASIPTPPPPPTPAELDPTAPAADEPTGAVIDAEVFNNSSAVERAEEYADQAKETADAAEEAAKQ